MLDRTDRFTCTNVGVGCACYQVVHCNLISVSHVCIKIDISTAHAVKYSRSMGTCIIVAWNTRIELVHRVVHVQDDKTVNSVMLGANTVVRKPAAAPRQPGRASTLSGLPPFLIANKEEGVKVEDDSNPVVHAAQHSRKTHLHVALCSLGACS